MGNTTSAPKPLRRLSRASIASGGADLSRTDSKAEGGGGGGIRAVQPEPGEVPTSSSNSNPNPNPAYEIDPDEFDDEAFDLPTFATRRPLRRRSAPPDVDNDDNDVDTLCDSASIMTSFTDTTMTNDPLAAYAAGSTVVSTAVDAAMDVLNGHAKGWRRDVALAQLEWLAADGARRARWVRAEAQARIKRANRGRRASLGGGSKSKNDLRLSKAGEERVVSEDTATARRVAMEQAAGDCRAAVEEDAKVVLERAKNPPRLSGEVHHRTEEYVQPESVPDTNLENGHSSQVGEEERYRAHRAAIRAAETAYHNTCAEAAKAHAQELSHAALVHERAFSASKVTYMGARLRDPDAQGEVTFTSAAGGNFVPERSSHGAGYYKVGRWGAR